MLSNSQSIVIKTTISLFALALVIRIGFALALQFDGLYGQDSFAYLKQAIAITESLPRGELPPRDFFWPNGYPMLAAIFIWTVGKSVFAAKLVNLLSGAALAPLIYALSRAVLPRNGHWAGVLAGLIVAIAGQPILSSVVVMADITALFWATLGAWLLACVWNNNKYNPRKLALAGVALGLAVVTRWSYALLAVPFVVFSLYQVCRYKTPWWHLAVPAGIGIAILVPQIWLSASRPESLIHKWLLSWRPWNAFGRSFSSREGYVDYLMPVGLFYLQPAGHPGYMFPLFGLAVAWGMWRIWQISWRTNYWSTIILLGGWVGCFYIFLAGIPYQNLRYGLAMYPPLLVFAGFGTSELLKMPVPNWFPSQKYWKTAINAGIVISLFGTGLWAVRANYRFITPFNYSKVVAKQIEGALPEGATLLAFGITSTLEYYTTVNVLEFFYFDVHELETFLEGTNPAYLIVDTQNIATQWRGKDLDTSFQWLRDNTTLTQQAYYSPYTLFQIQAYDAKK